MYLVKGGTDLWNGLLGEEFVNILPERNVWSGAVHTYCSFSSGKTKRKNKFYQKRYIFLHCIENWNFFPFGMKYLLFWEKGKKAIEKEADGCCCLCSTPRLLHHLARMWGHRSSFFPLLENICEFTRNKQVTYSPALMLFPSRCMLWIPMSRGTVPMGWESHLSLNEKWVWQS